MIEKDLHVRADIPDVSMQPKKVKNQKTHYFFIHRIAKHEHLFSHGIFTEVGGIIFPPIKRMFSILFCNCIYLLLIKMEYTDANYILPSWQGNMNNALSVQHPINAIIYNSLEIDNAKKLLSIEPAVNCLRYN